MKIFRYVLCMTFVLARPCVSSAAPFSNPDQSAAYFSIAVNPDIKAAGALTVIYWPHYLLGIDKPTDMQNFQVSLSDNRYEFRIHGVSREFGRIYLSSNATGTVFNKQVIEPGDSIVMDVQGKLSGRGFEKYAFWNSNSVDAWTWNLYNASQELQPGQLKYAVDTALVARYKLLDAERRISAITREILKFDLQGEVYQQLLYMLQTRYEKEENLRTGIESAINEMLRVRTSASENERYSSFYLEYLLKLRLFTLIIKNEGKSLVNTSRFTYYDLYQLIRNSYTGKVREKLLAQLIGLGYYYATFEFPGIDARQYTQCMKDAVKLIHDPHLKQFVRNELDTRGKGAKAFDFTVTDSLGNKIRLQDYRGKAVLLDIWLAPCGGCQVFRRFFGKEIYPVVKDYEDFVVISISADERDKWLRELDHHSWPYFVNTYTDGLKFDHPLMKHYNVMAVPFLLLLDKEGKVVSSTIRLEGKEELLALINEARRDK